MSAVEFSPGDRIALLALAISIGSAGYNVHGWWRGAEITVKPPKEVELLCHAYDYDKERCLPHARVNVVGSTFDYVNTGQQNYNAVISWEQAILLIEDRDVVLDWKYFTNYTSADVDMAVSGSRVVHGGSAHVHETQFDARRLAGVKSEAEQRTNFLNWSEFGEMVQGKDELVVRFISQVYEDDRDKKYTFDCKIYLTPERQERLRNPYYRQFLFPCSYG